MLTAKEKRKRREEQQTSAAPTLKLSNQSSDAAPKQSWIQPVIDTARERTFNAVQNRMNTINTDLGAMENGAFRSTTDLPMIQPGQLTGREPYQNPLALGGPNRAYQDQKRQDAWTALQQAKFELDNARGAQRHAEAQSKYDAAVEESKRWGVPTNDAERVWETLQAGGIGIGRSTVGALGTAAKSAELDRLTVTDPELNKAWFDVANARGARRRAEAQAKYDELAERKLEEARQNGSYQPTADSELLAARRDLYRAARGNDEQKLAEAQQAYNDLYEQKRQNGSRLMAWSDSLDQAYENLSKAASKHEEQAKLGLDKVGQMLVDIGVTGIPMLADAALNVALPGTGLAAMGFRAFGDASQQARLQGATVSQQRAYGIANAAVEVLTEKMFDGVAGIYGKGAADDFVEGFIKEHFSKGVPQALAKLATSFAGEAIEEGVAGLVDPMLELTFKDATMAQQYDKEWLKEMGYEMLIGGILGFLGGHVDLAKEALSLSERTTRALVQYDEAVAKHGMNSKEAKAAGEKFKALYAKEKAQEVKAIQKSTGYKPGSGVNQQLSGNIQSDVTPSVLDRATTEYMKLGGDEDPNKRGTSMNLETAQKKAAIIDKAMNGETLTPIEINALNLTDAGMREVFNNVTGLQLDEGVNQLLNQTNGRQELSQQIQNAVLQQQAQEMAVREAEQRARYFAKLNAEKLVDPRLAANVQVDNYQPLSYNEFEQAFQARSPGANTDNLYGIYEQYLGEVGQQMGEPTVNVNGVDMNRFQFISNSNRMHDQLGEPHSDPRVLRQEFENLLSDQRDVQESEEQFKKNVADLLSEVTLPGPEGQSVPYEQFRQLFERHHPEKSEAEVAKEFIDAALRKGTIDKSTYDKLIGGLNDGIGRGNQAVHQGHGRGQGAPAYRGGGRLSGDGSVGQAGRVGRAAAEDRGESARAPEAGGAQRGDDAASRHTEQRVRAEAESRRVNDAKLQTHDVEFKKGREPFKIVDDSELERVYKMFPELRKIERTLQRAGAELSLMTGGIDTGRTKADGTKHYADGGYYAGETKADGTKRDGTILAQLNSGNSPLYNRIRHEFHHFLYETNLAYRKATDELAAKLNKMDGFDELLREHYDSTFGPYTPILGDFAAHRAEYMQELIGDLTGNINRGLIPTAQFNAMRKLCKRALGNIDTNIAAPAVTEAAKTVAETDFAPEDFVDPKAIERAQAKYGDEAWANGYVAALNNGEIMQDANGDAFVTKPEDHIDNRTYAGVGKRSVKAFQFLYPDIHKFYEPVASVLLDELGYGQKGGEITKVPAGRGPGDDTYLRSKRSATEAIETLLDDYGLSYAEIEKACNAIIADKGTENFAAAKRVELLIDELLESNYESVQGPLGEIVDVDAYREAKAGIPGAAEETDLADLLWTAPDDNGGWKQKYNGDIQIIDALKIVDGKLADAFDKEASVEGTGEYPIVNAYVAAWNDVRQGTISPMAAATLLSRAYQENGIDGLRALSNPNTGNLKKDSLAAAKQIDEEHQSENELPFSVPAGDSRVFYTPRGIEVVQNPTDQEYRQMREEVYKDFPNMRKTGEPPLRRTFDENGNEYYWRSDRGTHASVEPYINEHYNTRTSQHWKWWEKADKDDYPIRYSVPADETTNESVDTDTEQSYNESNEAGREFQSKFSGNVYADRGIKVSGREKIQLRGELKKGNAHIDPTGLAGRVYTEYGMYDFDVIGDDVVVMQRVETRNLGTHKTGIEEAYNYDRSGRDQATGNETQRSQGRQRNGAQYLSPRGGAQQAVDDGLAGRESESDAERVLPDVYEAPPEAVQVNKLTRTTYVDRAILQQLEANKASEKSGASSMPGFGDLKYSIVTDPETLEQLNSGETMKAYRAMQLIDGKLYPPMAAKVAEEAGGKRKLVAPTEMGEWYQSDERPDLIDPTTGKFKLDKANGSSPLDVAYNPYFHTSATPLNDQFTSANKRPNLVTVEVEIPKSELTSGYKAQYAKDSVGETKWHAGPVASQLKGDKARRVFLSRWAKVNRIVPDAEVARIVAKTLEGENIAIPYNVVTPSLRAELEKAGVPIDTTGEKKSAPKVEPAYNRTALLKESTVDKYLKDYASPSTPKYAQAYITWMSPNDFLDLTTSRGGRVKIDTQTTPLDTAKLAEATQGQPFQLRIDHATGEVSGHEGRHRANALLRAGVDRIPVLLFDSSNKYDKARIDELTLKGQDFGGSKSDASVTAHDLIPLSYENRDAIVKKFTTQPTIERMNERYNGAETIRYSIPADDSRGRELSPEQREYFKDSKAVDNEGRLLEVYHGTTTGGFTRFEKTDDIGYFFTSSHDLAITYSGAGKEFAPKRLRNWDEAATLADYYGYHLAKNADGEWEMSDDDGKLTSFAESELEDVADWLYDEEKNERMNYAVYLNLTDPLIVEGNGRNWDSLVEAEYQHQFDAEIDDDDTLTLTITDRATGDTVAELTVDSKEDLQKELEKLYGDDGDAAEYLARQTYSGARSNWRHTYVNDDVNVDYGGYLDIGRTTREFVQEAKDMGCDGVIFRNITDTGRYGYGSESGDVYVVMDSEQIKSINNTTPTSDSDIRYSIPADDSVGRELSPVQRSYFQNSKVINDKGELKPAYHGTSRADRVGTMFLPERATSGPMAFFTDNKEIAENYAKSKRDTSMSYDEDYDSYETQFRVKVGNRDIPLIKAWGYLPFDARKRVTENAGHVREDWDGDNEIIFDPDTNDANGGFQWHLKEFRGNAFAALNEQWLNGGTLFDEEEKYLDVLRKVGVFDELAKIKGMGEPYYKDPNYREEKVYEAYLNITNPFDTATVDEDFIKGFEDWYDKVDQSKYERESVNADMWDKNSVTAEDFADRLRRDLESGTTHAWTSIPDSMTDYLKSLEYDGIVDKGGKNGGIGHTVYIPFFSNQVKSVDNKAPSFDPDIRYSIPVDEEEQKWLAWLRDVTGENDDGLGAADRGSVNTAYDNLQAQSKDFHPSGPAPVRHTDVPKTDFDGRNVPKSASTIYGAQATPDSSAKQLEGMIASGELSFDTETDKKAVNLARRTMNGKGFDGALEQYRNNCENGVASKDNTALGQQLLIHAMQEGNDAAVAELLSLYTRNSTTVAQALQAQSMFRKLSPEGQLVGLQKAIEALNEKYGTELGMTEEEIGDFTRAATQEEREEVHDRIVKRIADLLPKNFKSKFDAIRYLAMLGNPRTHIRNILGNAFFQAPVAVKNRVGALGELIANAVSGGKVERTKSLTGIKSRALIKEAQEDFLKVKDQLGSISKYSEGKSQRSEIEQAVPAFRDKGLGKAVNWASQKNSDLLEAEDMAFKRFIYVQSLSGYLQANGIDSIAEAEKSIEGRKLLARARNYAAQEAMRNTFNDRNVFSDAVAKLGKLSRSDNKVERAAGYVVEGVVPFKRTPTNILVRAGEYSPLGAANGIVQIIKGAKAGDSSKITQGIDRLAAGLSGSALMYLGMVLAGAGLIRGGDDEDEKQKNFDSLRRHQKYSVELPNGKSATLDWLAPESIPFFMGVELYNAALEGGLTYDDVMKVIKNTTSPMLEMSMLQGLHDMFENAAYAKNNGGSVLGSVLTSALTSYVTQIFPTILGQGERTAENQRMTTYTDKNSPVPTDWQYTLGKVSQKVPGWDYNQIPYIDAWGRTTDTGTPGERAAGNFLNPAYVSNLSVDKVEDELQRLYDQTGENVLPQRADRKITVNGEDKQLTADEYVRYATRLGTLSYELVSSLVSNPSYSKLNDAEKAKAVESMYTYAKATTKEELFGVDLSGTAARAIDDGVSPANYAIYSAQIASLQPTQGRKTVSDLQKYHVITDTNMSQKEKVAAIGAIMGTDMTTDSGNPSQYAKMLELLNSGISLDHYLTLRDKKEMLDHGDGTADHKATLYADWVNKVSWLNDNQRALVKADITFSSGRTASANEKALALAASGKMTIDEYYAAKDDYAKFRNDYYDGADSSKARLMDFIERTYPKSKWHDMFDALGGSNYKNPY